MATVSRNTRTGATLRRRARSRAAARRRPRAPVESRHGDLLPGRRRGDGAPPPLPALARAPTLSVLVAAYVIACRAQFDIADGYTVPTELVLVPMLFLLPTPIVPLVVSLSWALGRLIDYATGSTNIARAFHVFGDCWHAVGPALVLVVAGAQVFSWDDWPIYVARPARPVRLRLRRQRDPRLADRRHPAAGGPATDGPRLRARRRAGPDRAAGGLRGDRARAGDLPARDPAGGRPRGPLPRAPGPHRPGARAERGLPGHGDAARRRRRGRRRLHRQPQPRRRRTLAGGRRPPRAGPRQRRNVEFAALLHDVGKIAVPKEIINKPGPLDDDEWKIMHRHTIEGEANARTGSAASSPRSAASSAPPTSTTTAAATPTAWPARRSRSRPGSSPAATPSAR